jgi:hypothetical protein
MGSSLLDVTAAQQNAGGTYRIGVLHKLGDARVTCRSILCRRDEEGMMAVDERTRHELFVALEGVLGREEAVTLMEHLPPSGWGDVVTKADLADALSGVARQADFDGLRIDLDHVKADLAHLRGDMNGRFGEVDRRFAEVDRRFGEVQDHILTAIDASEQRVLATIRGEMVSAMGQQSRLMAFSLVGALTANTGLVLAALRLGT